MRPKPDVICRRMGDAAVLVDLSTNQVFELNRTGHRIWELLSEGINKNAITKRLQEEFIAESHQVEEEVESLLMALSDAQLIHDDQSNGRY